MLLAVTFQEKFYSNTYLEMLRNIPDMTWTAGINERFAHHTRSEIKAMLLTESQVPKSFGAKVQLDIQAPKSFSWIDEAPDCHVVRDQGNCGSCWSFAVTGAFSSNRCIKKVDKKFTLYSEQYLVNCDKTNSGCNGGNQNRSITFLVNNGIALDSCIPYVSGMTGVVEACATTCKDASEIKLAKATKFIDVAPSVENIKAGLQLGILTTHFKVSDDFMYYTSGIYQKKTPSFLGWHAVIFVGYGEENGVKYWTVRNSWGSAWGENGYFRIIRGQNECEIESTVYAIETK